MPLSIPGVLVSRDGSVRDYVGHSNRTGTLFGRIEKEAPHRWRGTCAGCGSIMWSNMQADGVRWLRDHWLNADASMASTHEWVSR